MTVAWLKRSRDKWRRILRDTETELRRAQADLDWLNKRQAADPKVSRRARIVLARAERNELARRVKHAKSRIAARTRQIAAKQPTGNAALFADLSGHNENVDLAAYKRAGHTRIALKATEGTDFTSSSFPARWQHAKRLGLERWAYHFARPSRSSAKAEARAFMAFVRAAGLTVNDTLVLDFEDPDYAGRNGDAWVRAFRDECKRLGHSVTILYSYGPYIAGSLTSLHGLDYWHAGYLTNPESTIPGFARAHTVAIQFTDGEHGNKPHYLPGCGTVGGVRRCDVNRITNP